MCSRYVLQGTLIDTYYLGRYLLFPLWGKISLIGSNILVILYIYSIVLNCQHDMTKSRHRQHDHDEDFRVMTQH